jgi:hypothetical protein
MNIIERHKEKILGTISCYDRIVLQGIIPGISHANGMTSHLYARGIRIFDYEKEFAMPLRDEITEHCKRLAAESGIEVEYIRRKNFRKEERVKEVLEKRGNHPGLVHMFSALEPCTQYTHWHEKETGKTFLKGKIGKCLHYYFYFFDEELGLMYVRVPTWVPFRLQIYFNGHAMLASKLKRKNISYSLIENAFVSIDNFEKAQRLAEDFDVAKLHKKLDGFARRFCPVVRHFSEGYHWSIWQIEYATDIIFKSQEALHGLYEHLTRTAIHAVKPAQIATFLGKKLHGNYQGEVGNDFNTRIEGTRIRHSMGKSSIKMYDKFGRVLRIETSTYDVTFFKHYRSVEQRDGTIVEKIAPMKKAIYSLPILKCVLHDANRRYLDFISSFEDVTGAHDDLNRISNTKREEGNHSYKGFNFFNKDDEMVLRAVASGEFMISGFRNKHIRAKLPEKSPFQVSRILKRLRIHGLIKKIWGTLKYYLTSFGRKVITAGLVTKECVIIPKLAGASC